MYNEERNYFENTLKAFISCASMVIEEHGASWTPLYIIKKCTSMLALLSRDSGDKLGEACSIFNEYCHNIFEHEIDDETFEDYEPDTDMEALFDEMYDRDGEEDEDYDWDRHRYNWSVFFKSRTCARLIGDSMHIDPDDNDRMIRPCLENYDWSNDCKFREYLFDGIYTVFKCMPADQKKYATLIVPIIMSALGIKTVTFCKVTDMKDSCSIYRFMERVCADVLRIDSSIPAIAGSPIYRELIDIVEQSSFAEVADVELFKLYRR